MSGAPSYLAPELGDLLPALTAKGVPVRIVAPVAELDRCSICEDNLDREWPPAAAVAEIVRATASGWVLRDPSCAPCLVPGVAWELRFRSSDGITVEIPLHIGATT